MNYKTDNLIHDEVHQHNINIFIGIDPSLNSTGITIISDCGCDDDNNTNNYIFNRMFVVKPKLTKKETKILEAYNNKHDIIYKLNEPSHDFYFNAITYNHDDANYYNREPNKDSHKFELLKTTNIINIVYKIEKIIKDNIFDIVCLYLKLNSINSEKGYDEHLYDGHLYNIRCHTCIETNSFNSRQHSVSLVELCGLNYLIRNMILNLDWRVINLRIRIAESNLLCATPTEIKKFATYRGDADKELMLTCFKLLQPNIIKELDGFKLDDVADSYFMCLYAIYNYEKENLNDSSTFYKNGLFTNNDTKAQLISIIEDKKEKKKKDRLNKKSLKNKEQIWDDDMMSFADKI